jgi:hypothetical protein
MIGVVSAPLWDTASATFAGKLTSSVPYAKLTSRNVYCPRRHSYHSILLSHLELGGCRSQRRAPPTHVYPR